MNYKIIGLRTNDNRIFVIQHVNSKYHNNFEGQYISMDQLLHELHGYSIQGLICLEETIYIKDIEQNKDDFYKLIERHIISNKLENKVINIILFK